MKFFRLAPLAAALLASLGGSSSAIAAAPATAGAYTFRQFIQGVVPATCALPWGGTISQGAAVTAYQTSDVPYGQTCVGEARSCSGGVLSGSYAYGACQPAAPSACVLPWGGTIAHGESVKAYPAAEVPYGGTCASQMRTCSNGVLSGAFEYGACQPAAPATCTLPWGGTIQEGQSVAAYPLASVSFGGSCGGEMRVCGPTGQLTGTYTAQSCTQGPSTTTWNTATMSSWPVGNATVCISATNGALTLGEKEGCGNSYPRAAATTTRSGGKWYFEVQVGSTLPQDLFVGIGAPTAGTANSDWRFTIQSGVSNVLSGITLPAPEGKLLSFAVDLDANKIWVAANCTWIGNPSAGTSGTSIAARPVAVAPIWTTGPSGLPWGSAPSNKVTANFGGSAFGCAVPQGFNPGW